MKLFPVAAILLSTGVVLAQQPDPDPPAPPDSVQPAPSSPPPPPTFALETPVDYPRDAALAAIHKWFLAIQMELAKEEMRLRGGDNIGIPIGPSVSLLPEAEWLHLIDRTAKDLASPDNEVAKAALYMAAALEQTAMDSPSLRNAIGSEVFPAALNRMKTLRPEEARQLPPLVHVLAPFADPDISIPAMITASQSENVDVRRAGVMGLQAIATEKRYPVIISDAKRIAMADALFARAEDSDRLIRYLAISSIGHLHPPADPYLAKLTALLKSPDEKTQSAAARAIQSYGEGAASQTTLLIEMLKSPNMKDRMKACMALRGIGPAGKAAIPELITNLECPDPLVAEYALITITCMGPDAQAALPKLDEMGAKSGDFAESCRKAAAKIRKANAK